MTLTANTVDMLVGTVWQRVSLRADDALFVVLTMHGQSPVDILGTAFRTCRGVDSLASKGGNRVVGGAVSARAIAATEKAMGDSLRPIDSRTFTLEEMVGLDHPTLGITHEMYVRILAAYEIETVEAAA